MKTKTIRLKMKEDRLKGKASSYACALTKIKAKCAKWDIPFDVEDLHRGGKKMLANLTAAMAKEIGRYSFPAPHTKEFELRDALSCEFYEIGRLVESLRRHKGDFPIEDGEEMEEPNEINVAIGRSVNRGEPIKYKAVVINKKLFNDFLDKECTHTLTKEEMHQEAVIQSIVDLRNTGFDPSGYASNYAKGIYENNYDRYLEFKYQ